MTDITLNLTPTIAKNIDGSSTIKRVQYWPESIDGPAVSILRVTFHSGGTYRFDDVPEATAQAFVNAVSAGKYFAAHIKGKFPSRKEA